ncbi:hypothetical protein AJ85_03735 [Alkalihalobacillus alcalophilus ATCC 27647 = CGMCC 1.3604]|uniref:Glycosyl transferase family 1 domain-containing protein n=1 Tax=Alkalihalobacillus alcalophilus ATCC 27647 = CGMCC 1.3604 TaxID=1218173 RepID=A0A094WEX5_ALKAL|nr:glycosyltransferase [Alkalihalobacillus alcalophilus]KGA96289.1 hypothetical protein BALCAV_0217200 [Alkalihalobacillus alcalophilus ATCC 27647 = CGMCC 1.3604]MED1563391.1 glycosyltransferase [Alkalihalobacillus alcalophilus]THG91642.1 hypothetical protein AJ85_03735 [Alkalihalobacillus alcalophilus ATCC 27647 = CGMCC 1.3604]
MENVLVILGSYFPKPSPNGICVHKVAKELQKEGVKITVIAKQSSGLTEYENIDDIDIYRVRGRWFNRVMDWCTKNKEKKYEKIVRKSLLFLNKIKSILCLPIWPILSPMYSCRLYKKAKELHRGNNYDHVISVYNPIDALVAGVMLKKKFKSINLNLYFLDTLSGGIVPKYLTRDWLKKRGWFWESRFFGVADNIYVMESHREHYLSNTYRNFHHKIDVVDIPLLKKIEHKEKEGQLNLDFCKEKIHFVYTGMLLKQLKNPSYMLALFKKLSDRYNCVFHIFGGGDCEDIIKKYKNKMADGAIIIHGQVDLQSAHNALLKSDFLINIGSLVDCQITGKIFEYVSTGKPIISFYSSESEPSIPYLEKYPLSLLIKEDWEKVDENCLKVSEFIESVKGKKVKYEQVEKIYYNNTPVQTAKKIAKLY